MRLLVLLEHGDEGEVDGVVGGGLPLVDVAAGEVGAGGDEDETVCPVVVAGGEDGFGHGQRDEALDAQLEAGAAARAAFADFGGDVDAAGEGDGR